MEKLKEATDFKRRNIRNPFGSASGAEGREALLLRGLDMVIPLFLVIGIALQSLAV